MYTVYFLVKMVLFFGYICWPNIILQYSYTLYNPTHLSGSLCRIRLVPLIHIPSIIVFFHLICFVSELHHLVKLLWSWKNSLFGLLLLKKYINDFYFCNVTSNVLVWTSSVTHADHTPIFSTHHHEFEWRVSERDQPRFNTDDSLGIDICEM